MDQGTKERDTARQLAPRSYQGMAQEVTALLGGRTQATIRIRNTVIDQIIRHILTRDLFDSPQAATALASQRISDRDALETYIPAAARRLGAMWDKDLVDFTQVSIATARLQALAHDIAARHPRHAPPRVSHDICLLVATLAGEDHTLGAVTLAETLRASGQIVALRLGVTAPDLGKELMEKQHDAVLFSCAKPEGLASLTTLIQDIRQHQHKPPVLAIGGAVLDHVRNIQEQTGADLVTRDTGAVIKLAVSFRKGRIIVVK